MSKLLKVVLFTLFAADADAQGRLRKLEAAKDLSAEPYSNLVAVRELPGAKGVLTLDIKELMIGLLDPVTGASKPVGRVGEGPGEYRRPGYFFNLGDSTLVGDVALRRLLVIDETGKATGAAVPAWRGEAAGAAGLPVTADAARRAYFTTSGVAMVNGSPVLQDSTYIVRVAQNATRVDSIARISLPKTAIRTQSDKNGNMTSVNIVRPPVALADDWVVFADGKVAIVRAEPYRVDWAISGRVVRGAPLPFEGRSLSASDKRAVLVARAAATAAPGVRIGEEPIESYEWPESAPAFNGPSALPDPAGRVWIRRFRFAADRATLYDVVGADGRLTFQVEVPGAGRVVGFGREAVYFTRVDDDGLQYIRRAPLPR